MHGLRPSFVYSKVLIKLLGQFAVSRGGGSKLPPYCARQTAQIRGLNFVQNDVDSGTAVWYNKGINEGKVNTPRYRPLFARRPIPTTDMTVRETTDRKAANNFGAVGARHRAFLFYSLQKGDHADVELSPKLKLYFIIKK